MITILCFHLCVDTHNLYLPAYLLGIFGLHNHQTKIYTILSENGAFNPSNVWTTLHHPPCWLARQAAVALPWCEW